MKRIFTKELLIDELDLPYNRDIVKSDEPIDTSRWSISHELVFKYEGKFYMTYYSVGATECQDESPWEFEESVDCFEVELKEVVVKKWVTIDE